AASCTGDADCGLGLHCASNAGQPFTCQQPGDACLVDADCGGMSCILDSVRGVRVCSGGNVGAIGRPFLVDDVARVASTVRRCAWPAGGLAPDHTPELRQRLVQEWTRAAQLEHASIAAFSRFLLELLAFGAPAELCAETISALADERRHAEICFALASHFAGE